MVYSKFWIRIVLVVNADVVFHEYNKNTDDITQGLLTQYDCDVLSQKWVVWDTI